MSTPSNPGYETIPEDEDEQPLELTAADESSHIGDIKDNNDMPSKKYVVSACILILLLTFIGGRQSITTFSSKSNIDIIGGATTANRLCEIYHYPSSEDSLSNIRIIQTSLSEPSKQWNEVPCLIHNSAHNRNNRKLHPSDTSHSSSNPESSSSSEYYPSAIIHVDFTSQPFRKRQPILGFGGAFTEAAALNFNSLSKDGKAVALELLFGKDGLGYRYVLCVY